MKNRKNMVIAFMLVAVMLLGIGFAALTDSLTITGTATADMDGAQALFDGKVGFSACKLEGTGAEDTTTGAYTSLPDAVTFDATGFTKVGDTVEITYTIKNEHPDLAATVAVPTITPTDNEYFEAKTDWTAAKELDAVNGTVDVKVTVTMIKAPQEAQTATFTLTLGVTSK